MCSRHVGAGPDRSSMAIVLATHDEDVGQLTDRRIRTRDGSIRKGSDAQALTVRITRLSQVGVGRVMDTPDGYLCFRRDGRSRGLQR
jgi:hypothetical protein